MSIQILCGASERALDNVNKVQQDAKMVDQLVSRVKVYLKSWRNFLTTGGSLVTEVRHEAGFYVETKKLDKKLFYCQAR